MSRLRQLIARQPIARQQAPTAGPTLRRALGWPGLTAIGLGTMLGGIFPTIGAGAHVAGPAVILAYLFSGLVSLCVALCYAEFASMVPIAGSAYTYAYATLGELAAWIIGWDLILEYGLSVAPTASSLSDYAQHLLARVGIALPLWARHADVFAAHPTLGSLFRLHVHVDAIAAFVTLGIAVLVAIGIRESARVNGTLVIFQVLALLLFLAIALPAVHPANLTPFAPHGWHGIVTGTALVFYAYIGFDTVTVASEEAKDPHRHVPLAILLALAIGAGLYVAIAYATVGVMPYARLSDGAAMLDALSAVSHNGWFYALIALGGVAGNATVMLTSLLGQIRIFYVMARDRMLPPGVATIHPIFRTPARMTLITGAVVAVLAAILPLADLLDFVNIGTLSAFAIVCAGVLVLRIVEPDAPRPFRAPLAPLFTVLGSLGCIYLISGLSLPTWLRFVAWFCIGMALYFLYGFHRSLLRKVENS
ncbi:MAG TPA: amino acid permease [Candidatus Dormibacteraeota bacterium]|nr:amino acid permease [Candidatus Dormibacteraeota bacterium]